MSDHGSKGPSSAALFATLSADALTNAGAHLVEILPVKTLTVPPYTTTNAVFFGRTAFWVIDPGTPHDEERQLLHNYISQRHARGHQFLGVCLTHHHGDHSKAAEYLAQEFSVPILAHRAAMALVKFPFHPIDDGEAIAYQHEPPLLAIHTPGHADDHVVYYQRDLGIVIAGDMITDRGTILIPPEGGSLSVYLDSLDKLSKLFLSAIVPAHGKVITHQPNLFLVKAMRHRYERIKAVLAAIRNHHTTLDATDITRLVYRDNIEENLMVFAQLSVESSLHWLKEKGLLENPHHAWKVAQNITTLEQSALLNRLEEIDERLRNA